MQATVQLAGYELVELIGGGTSSEVYRARETASDREVAVKLMRQTDFTDKLLEIGNVVSLRHPTLLGYEDFIYLRDGRLAIVYEYVPGGDLRRHLPEGKVVSAAAVRQTLWQLLEGLGYLHEHGLVHCDLKPENILVAQWPEPVRVKLGDLGSAQRLVDLRRGRIKQAGSPLYMAPERLYNEFGERADLYSLGVIAYEMLSGRPPFTGSVGEIVKKCLHGQIDLGPVPQEFRDWLHGLLAYEPQDRFANTREAQNHLPGPEARAPRWKTFGLREQVTPVSRALETISSLRETLQLSCQQRPDDVELCQTKDRLVLALAYADYLELGLIQHGQVCLRSSLRKTGPAWTLGLDGSVYYTVWQELRRWRPGEGEKVLTKLSQPIHSLKVHANGKWAAATGGDGYGLIELESGHQTWHRLRKCGIAGDALPDSSGGVLATISPLKNRLLCRNAADNLSLLPLAGSPMACACGDGVLRFLTLSMSESQVRLCEYQEEIGEIQFWEPAETMQTWQLGFAGLVYQTQDGDIWQQTLGGGSKRLSSGLPLLELVALSQDGGVLATVSETSSREFSLVLQNNNETANSTLSKAHP